MKDKKPYKQGLLSSLTPELMEGYVKGTLPPHMMQKVGQFLAENPFEADAMEGFKSHPVDLIEDFKDLESRLSHKVRREDSNKYFWPVAAAVSLMVISGFLFYFLIPGAADKVALNQEVTEVKPKSPSESVLEIDPETLILDDEVPAPASEITEETVIIEVPDEEENEDSEEQIEANLDVETAAPAIDNLASETQTNKPEFIDEPKLPSGQNEEQVSATREDAIADNSHRQLVADQGKAKKTAAPAAGLQIAREYNKSIELPVVEPPEGIRDYMKKHTNYPQAAEEKDVRGSVLVTFIVNKAGGLENFEVVQELGFGCDEEVVKSLSKGPPWKPAEINGIPVRSRGRFEMKFPPTE